MNIYTAYHPITISYFAISCFLLFYNRTVKNFCFKSANGSKLKLYL